MTHQISYVKMITFGIYWTKENRSLKRISRLFLFLLSLMWLLENFQWCLWLTSHLYWTALLGRLLPAVFGHNLEQLSAQARPAPGAFSV